jgi:hypothetical protein
MRYAASPDTSLMGASPVVITIVPDAIASAIGQPKPSPNEGNKNKDAPAYAEII